MIRRKTSVLVLLILKHINSGLSDENCTSCSIPKSTLRHLLIHLDGATSGPRVLIGKIGKAMSTCEKLPIVVFTPLESDLPPMILSTDQKYLYDICDAVSKGFCSVPLSRRDPGALSYSRWLTAANRLLRLYVSTKDPSAKLIIIVTYFVYSPMWFVIKSKSF